MKHIDQYLAQKLEQRMLEGNLRHLTINRAATDLYSNDYLGFATSGILHEDANAASAAAGLRTGSTGSRLLSGNSRAAEELEHTIARFHAAKAALLFNSGYDANIGLLSCIASRDSCILSDERCHASIIDGIRLSQCTRKYKFRHNDIDDLQKKLKRHAGGPPVIVVIETVYSMDGDIAPLNEIATLCEQYNAHLVADEAHATGVFGAHGEGLVQAAGLQNKVFARIHTFGKALGSHGAAIAGGELLKQYLINFARPFIYTTALPGHTLSTISNAYKFLSDEHFTNRPLHDLIAYFRSGIQRSDNKSWKDSTSPIQVLLTGSNERSKQLAAALQNAGLEVKPILHPTVPAGQECLRICLHQFNTTKQIDLLFEILNQGSDPAYSIVK